MRVFDKHTAIDPNNYSSAQAWIEVKNLMATLCWLNSVPLPEFIERTPFDEGPGSFGLYRPGRVWVNVSHCALPVRGKPVRRYSYTGWKSDRTVPGVTAHEMGHHFDHFLGLAEGESYRRDAEWSVGVSSEPAWAKVLLAEPAVTSYEPNPSEAFAEAFRVFALNPDLLRNIWPRRYNFIHKTLSIQTSNHARWDQVLKNAHPWYHENAEKLIQKTWKRNERKN